MGGSGATIARHERSRPPARSRRGRCSGGAAAAPQGHLHPAQLVHAGVVVRRLLRRRDGDERALRECGDRHLLRDGAGQPGWARCADDEHAKRIRRADGQPVRYGELRRGASADRLRMVAQGVGQTGLDRVVRVLRRCGAAAGALQHQHRNRRQALFPGASESGRGGPGDRDDLGARRLRRARRRAHRLAGVDGVRGHAVCRPDDGDQRALLQLQGRELQAIGALHRDRRHRARHRGDQHPSAAGVVRVVLRLRPLGLCGVRLSPGQGQAGQRDRHVDRRARRRGSASVMRNAC